jgi:phosphoenolpyruvate synthase/pyruvate phosphate dikinase
VTPESFFIGSDVFYTFMSINNLFHWNDQSIRTRLRCARITRACQEFVEGEFRPDIAQRLEALLGTVGRQPLIVRSSSLLEDNFGTAFAGKYESVFLPNQGSSHENLKELTRAVGVYTPPRLPQRAALRRSRACRLRRAHGS